jgi:hypothetical protein
MTRIPEATPFSLIKTYFPINEKAGQLSLPQTLEKDNLIAEKCKKKTKEQLIRLGLDPRTFSEQSC